MPAFLSLFLISIRLSIFFVFAFLYHFMCCALFLIVHPILGNNMQVLGELPRKSKTMTRTWCILFLVLSPSCYSPSVCLHIFFVSVGSIIDGASHPRSSAPYWVCLHLMLHLFFLLLFRNKFFFSDFFFFWLPLDFVLLFFSSLVLVIHMRDFGISNQEFQNFI